MDSKTIYDVLTAATALASVVITAFIAYRATISESNTKRIEHLKSRYDLLVEKMALLLGYSYQFQIACTQHDSCKKVDNKESAEEWREEIDRLDNLLMPLSFELRFLTKNSPHHDVFERKVVNLLLKKFDKVQDGIGFQECCANIIDHEWQQIESLVGRTSIAGRLKK